MDKLLRSSFSTEELKKVDGISTSEVRDAWAEAMSVFFTPDQITDSTLANKLSISNDTSGFIDNILFPGMMSINVTASGHRFSRSAQDIANDGVDGILVQFWREGQLLSDESGDKHTRPGDIHLVDFSRETDVSASDFDTYNLLIPRELLADSVDLDGLHLKTLSGDHASVRLLRRHLYDLHTEAPNMTAAEGLALVDPTMALIKATLTATPGAQEEAAQIIDRNLLLDIKRFIDTNLSTPTLNPDMIAASLGLSRSRLYRLAEPLGGIQTFIRNRRLRHAFQLLVLRGNEINSLTALAYAEGFQSEDTFRRAFKNAFGMTPSEVKEQGMKAYTEYYSSFPKHKKSMAMGEHLYQQWVSDLFC
ncbi:helix-turn-helix domain-containing protein [Pontibacterium sp. N1Y112]|uniref:Helix-turn-helix domain-containing protein n=1 Tax=Pontibacterium sinense TaxID=2781979 RepID=A0A8J7FLU5_9GAMM|nr:helix-turn-helix domain-containing protein [Pontibacterium sinense]MBE9398608.1 helix-turn-helix domain-containing protein [Pontibacterium sinense]